MKATGVVRRIDDLGRIVIPKEIRKNLRIKDGESLEFFLDDDNIVLKKYSQMESLYSFYQIYIDAINDVLQSNILIVDKDIVVAASGSIKRTYCGKNISNVLDKVIQKRTIIIEQSFQKINFVDGEFLECNYIINPIFVSGDVVGAFIIASSNRKLDDFDIKLANIAVKFLGKHIE